MATTTADPESADLVETISLLSRSQLERLLCQVAARRQNHTAPNQRESELVGKLSQGIAREIWERYHQLQQEKEAEKLSPEDDIEIADVVEKIENYAAQKIQWLAELAGLRNQTVDEVITSLDLAR